MKITIIIVAVVLCLGAVAGFYIKRTLTGMAQGAKIIIIMQRLGQFSADLKKQGSFTNDIPHLADIYPFTNSYTINGTRCCCTLAARSPLFADRGVMAVTSEGTVLWVDRDGKATSFSETGSVTP
jgi:hypothetical protein